MERTEQGSNPTKRFPSHALQWCTNLAVTITKEIESRHITR